MLQVLVRIPTHRSGRKASEFDAARQRNGA
jgi:hypothetical protein